MIKKFFAELIGTMLLVLFGCGTAVVANQIANPLVILAIVPIALAFGLILMALCYVIGGISGCHVNPAVSIAMLINKKITILECIEYILAQLIGAVAGTEILGLILNSYESLGANGFLELSPMKTTMIAALVIETILTFVFVLVVLCVTSKKEEKSNNGLIIGATLALVHIFGIPFTGTSVNPARSFGPALLTTNHLYLEQLWVFIVGPLVGAIIAALIFRFVIEQKEETKKEKKSK